MSGGKEAAREVVTELTAGSLETPAWWRWIFCFALSDSKYTPSLPPSLPFTLRNHAFLLGNGTNVNWVKARLHYKIHYHWKSPDTPDGRLISGLFVGIFGPSHCSGSFWRYELLYCWLYSWRLVQVQLFAINMRCVVAQQSAVVAASSLMLFCHVWALTHAYSTNPFFMVSATEMHFLPLN